MMTARVPKVFLAMALGLALMSAMGVASANVLRWDLQNVTFQDDGKAIGYFLFDADAPPLGASVYGQIVGWDITLGSTNPNWPWRVVRFTPQSSVVGDVNPGDVRFFDPAFNNRGRGALMLDFSLDSSLSDAGGTIALSGSEVFETYSGPGRLGITGSVVAIPEPSETLLLALGLAALVGFSIRPSQLTAFGGWSPSSNSLVRTDPLQSRSQLFSVYVAAGCTLQQRARACARCITFIPVKPTRNPQASLVYVPPH